MKTNPSSWALSVVAVLFAASAWAMPSDAIRVGGISFAPQAKLGATQLQLNGAGVRQQSAQAMYAAALYLEKKQSLPEAAIQDMGAKRLTVTMLRDVSASEMSDLLATGLKSNSSDAELFGLMPEVFAMSTLIAETRSLRAGDSFQIDWSRAAGTSIQIQQKGQAKPAVKVFPNANLMPAMLRIWLGERPADPTLKSALLGSRT
jgi:Chalcone isomerase-like